MLKSLNQQEAESLSDWATKNFYLSPEYSSDPGLFSYERRPYQKEVLDEIGNPENEKVIIVAATQMLKTVCLMIAEAYKIEKRPGPLLHVMDTILNATRYSRERLDPMIRDNNYLSNKVQEVKPKKSDTVLMKKFVGGILKLVGANSPSGLIFTTVKDLLLDEVDSYPISASDFGDPVELAIKRTTEFEDRQIIMASSPGTEGASRIWPEWLETDQRYFFVPCAHCGEFQKLEWGGPETDYGIKWENNDPTTAYYLCCACHQKIYNRQKYLMNSRGEWVPTYPNRKGKPGFHINALHSPSSTRSWDKLVEEWLTARKFSKAGDHERLKVFINTSLAELWTPKINVPKEDKLLERVEDYYSPNNPKMPERVCFLTAFVDVQDTWLHCQVEGWGLNEENWLIEVKMFHGNPAQVMVWNELDQYLASAFHHQLDLSLYISAIAVDTGGHHSDAVYKFVKDRMVRRLNNGVIQKFYATKGYNQRWKPITDYKAHMNNRGGIPLYLVGTDTAKELIHNRMEITNPEKSGAGYQHFNHHGTKDYFDEIYSEMLQIDPLTKQRVYVPVPGKRHESLDCKVGNLFLLRLSKANLLNIYEDLLKAADKLKQGNLFSEQQPTQPAMPNSNWVNSWNK